MGEEEISLVSEFIVHSNLTSQTNIYCYISSKRELKHQLTQVIGLCSGAVALRWRPGRQAVSGRAGETLTGGQRSVEAGQTAAGLQQVGLLGDLAEQRVTLLAVRQTERCNNGKKTVYDHANSISVDKLYISPVAAY